MHSSLLPENFQFLWEGRQPLDWEIRMNYIPLSYNDPETGYKRVLVLFSKDGKAVPSECDSDFSAMVYSLRREFEKIVLDSESRGRFYFQTLGSDIPLQLIFREEGEDDIPKEVMRLPGIIQPTVYKNLIFFVSEGRLKTLDIFSQEIKDVPEIIYSTDEFVNEFYLYKNRIFYLIGGERCNDYMAKCAMKLFEYSFDTQQIKLLAESVNSRRIIGYDENRNILGMYHGEGDAGCFWIKEEQYVFATGKVESLESLNGCYDDNMEGPANEPIEMIKFKQFKSLFDNGVIIKDYLQVENGKIVLPPEQVSSFGWPIRYISQ